MYFSQLTNLIPMKPTLAKELTRHNQKIQNVTSDIRKIIPGSCFVAIKGFTFDGHQHLDEAVKKGAIVLIVDQPVKEKYVVPIIRVTNSKKTFAQLVTCFFGNPSKDLFMVGVTGTNGKTTVTNLVKTILTDHHVATGLIGTIGNELGNKNVKSINTTPDVGTIQSSLALLKEQQYQACAMEVSSIGLEQGRTWGTDFDVAVFTNLTEDHLDYHKTMENYFDAKSLLFSQLGNNYTSNGWPKTAVINIDDSYGRRLLNKTSAYTITYAIDNPSALLNAKNIKMNPNQTDFDIIFDHQEYHVKTKLVGKFNVYNVLAAFGVGIAYHLQPQEIISSLTKATSVTGRFQSISNDSGITAIVDYAHTPDGLKQVLKTIDTLHHHRVFCVVGAGGNRDNNKRHIMGEIALANATNVIFTSDNPRTENPQTIIEDLTKTLPKQADYESIVDRKTAIESALTQAQKGDVVLVAGKGHEDYQIIGTTKHHFSDIEIINNFLKKR